MKNSLLFKLRSKVRLNIKGKNINKFIKRLNDNKIDLIKIGNFCNNEANIIIYSDDYEKVLKLKTIYEVTETNIYGIIKMKKIVKRYRYILLFLTIGLMLLYTLSNIIFEVEIIHMDSDVKNLLLKELESRDITKYKFKKSYSDIQMIKKDILEKYKDSIEWIEIESVGTKYIVRLENRIIKDKEPQSVNRNIIAKKSAIIKKVVADNGIIVKEVDQYVNKGDTVISGNITLNDTVKEIVSAKGLVYGEVWYSVTVEYPYIYGEIKETGNIKEAYVLRILNKDFELWNYFKEKYTSDKLVLKNSIIPIKLIKQEQRETETISFILTSDEAINRAKGEAVNKIESRLDSDEEIIDYQLLSTDIEADKVVAKFFFSVLENITDYEEIINVEGD